MATAVVTAPQKWEYKVIYFGQITPYNETARPERELNQLGEQGWELVAVGYNATEWFLKRPKSN